jgi:small subunit ribosomal protein S1
MSDLDVKIEETAEPAVEGEPSLETGAVEGEFSIDTLREGQRLVGTVKNITEFGAFVDVGIPQDGLVHISKLAKRKVDKVTDVVSQGQQVEVWVKKVDRKRGRLSLTMIRPLALRLRDIEEEAELDGIVTRLEPYGAFIDIGSEREGLVHISQIGYDYIKHPEEVLAVGSEIKVKVLKVDRKKRQVDLSIKALLPPPPPKEVEFVKEEVKPVEREVKEEIVEEPSLTAMAVAYTARQGKSSAKEAKKGASKDKRRDIDDIVSRTLATRG